MPRTEPSVPASLSGYWFRIPAELNVLMGLSPAQLRVYLVVTHAIQRDRNGGLMSWSQIGQRAGLSRRHVGEAIETLCQGGLLVRVNRVRGAVMRDPAEWNGRTVKYANPIQWRQRDSENQFPTGHQSVENPDREPSEPATCPPSVTAASSLRGTGTSPLSVTDTQSLQSKREESSERVLNSKRGTPSKRPAARQNASSRRELTAQLRQFLPLPETIGALPDDAILEQIAAELGDAPIEQFKSRVHKRLGCREGGGLAPHSYAVFVKIAGDCAKAHEARLKLQDQTTRTLLREPPPSDSTVIAGLESLGLGRAAEDLRAAIGG
jgi:hypothetical protein